MSSIGFAFLIGVIGMVVSAHLARWAASYLVDEGKSAVAGFSFVLGAGTLRFGDGMGPSTSGEEIALRLGAALAMVAVWYLFFRRGQALG